MKGGLVPVVEVVRSGRVESVHSGVAAVVDDEGNIVTQAGEAELASYLRSAAKPVQLLAMLESGLGSAVALSDVELAVCAASHGGEPAHTEIVAGLLRRVGLPEGALRCGAHPPLDPDAAAALNRAGVEPSPLHNNCSGKHAAMLITAVANGWELEGYLDPGHPLQTAIRTRVGALAAAEPAVGVDGCGVPTFYLPVRAAARMAAALMALAGRGGNARRIVGAMTANPWFTSASSRFAYHLMRDVPGVLAKEGAEGFFIVGIPAERSPSGRALGLAVKVVDGAGEEARGREPAVASALISLGVLSPEEAVRLQAVASIPLRTVAGRTVGEVRGVLRL